MLPEELSLTVKAQCRAHHPPSSQSSVAPVGDGEILDYPAFGMLEPAWRMENLLKCDTKEYLEISRLRLVLVGSDAPIMLDPRHSLHWLPRQSCSHICAIPLILRTRLWGQMLDPMHSFQAFLRRSCSHIWRHLRSATFL